MPLPDVEGWLIDFRTARSIYGANSNQRIAHCSDLILSQTLHIAWCEEEAFKGVPLLRAAFLGKPSTVEEPVDEVLERCASIDLQLFSKAAFGDGELEITLAGIAMQKNYGVISDYKSSRFLTVFDIRGYYGFHVFTQDEYFALV